MKKLLLIVGMISIFSTPLYATIESDFFDRTKGEKGSIPKSTREKKFRKKRLLPPMNPGIFNIVGDNSPNGLSSDEEDQSPRMRQYLMRAIERRSKATQTYPRYESFNLSTQPDYIGRCIEYGFVGSVFFLSLIGSVYVFVTH